ncbi:MAG: purine-nucleoside phosphorylase, partial [Pseudomonadota bacterium]
MYEQIQRACESLRRQGFDSIDTGLVLGTGLGALPPAFSVQHTVGFDAIDGFRPASAPGHSGTLSVGEWHGRRVLILQGRFHLYEGLSAAEVVRPVYVLRALGARSLIVTNAAGGLNPAFAPAELMLITDHLNFTGVNPLSGVDDERLGPRFPDLSRAYAPALRRRALEAAAAAGIALRQGIYAAVHGP